MNAQIMQEEAAQIQSDEGNKLIVYLDTEGIPTAGYGHVVSADSGLKVGDLITPEQRDIWFEQDFSLAMNGAHRLIADIDDLPGQVQQVLVNMVYNMGVHGVAQWHHFLQAVQDQNWKEAGLQLKNSVAYTQEPNRLNRLIALLNSIEGATV